MRVLHLAAGAGSMYCGACAHDAAIVRGLIKRGHDVTVIPLYTPLKLEADDFVPTTRVFLGGINAYLQQRYPWFRRAPNWLQRGLDNASLLRWVSNFAVKTSPSDLGAMTVSVLKGAGGFQANELRRLMAFVEQGPKPDLVSITNSLLSFAAPMVRERLGVPVACLFQGEDGFVEAMTEPYRSEVQALMRSHADSIQLFLAPSETNADKMASFLGIDRTRIHVVRVGIESDGFHRTTSRADLPIAIGYLSVITRAKGLDMLVDAFIALANDFPDVELKVVGRALDKRYFRDQVAKLRRVGLEGRFSYRGEIAHADKVRFLHECDVFCLPSRIEESRGVAVMEALASGCAVVVPASGVFPEMLRLTGGGATFEPRNLESLIAALGDFLRDRARTRQLGQQGMEGVAAQYSASAMVAQTATAYEELVAG